MRRLVLIHGTEVVEVGKVCEVAEVCVYITASPTTNQLVDFQ